MTVAAAPEHTLARAAARYRRRRVLKTVGLGFAVVLVLVYTLFPYYWAIVSSLKTGASLFEATLLPAFELVYYKALLHDPVFLGSIVNSLIVAGSATGISLLLAIGAAYALGRLDFPLRRTVLLVILMISIFPQIVVLSGMFELVRWFGLYNRVGSLTFAYLIFTLPFTVWVLTGFIQDIPRELEEAALMDGASRGRVLVSVLLPLMGPALASTGLLAFIQAWNEFLFALTFTLTNEVRTVPVAIALISGATQFDIPWGNIMAASVVVTVPLIVLVMIFQRRIVSGLTAGAVKG